MQVPSCETCPLKEQLACDSYIYAQLADINANNTDKALDRAIERESVAEVTEIYSGTDSSSEREEIRADGAQVAFLFKNLADIINQRLKTAVELDCGDHDIDACPRLEVLYSMTPQTGNQAATGVDSGSKNSAKEDA
jgi:hypothetical protein